MAKFKVWYRSQKQWIKVPVHGIHFVTESDNYDVVNVYSAYPTLYEIVQPDMAGKFWEPIDGA